MLHCHFLAKFLKKTKSVAAIFLLVTISMFGQNSNSMQSQTVAIVPSIVVTIGGDAPVTGTFGALAHERLDQIMTRVFEKVSSKYALRGITIKRNQQEIIKADIERFRITGDYAFNPILKNEDVIICPNVNLDLDYFYIFGAIKVGGKHQFMEGDRLADAILLSQGLNPAYENVHQVEISRLSYDGLTEQIIRSEISENIEIKRGDRIRVVADENYRRFYGVYIAGEVKTQGFIPIARKDNNLASVISKAGGLLDTADPERAVVFNSNDLTAIYINRQNPAISLDQAGDMQRLQSGILEQISSIEKSLFLRTSNLTEEDTTNFAIETRLRTLVNQNRINVANYLDSASEAAHYSIQTGDIVYIPPKEKFVYVFGQVSQPGKISYVHGKDYHYYIDKCKGYGELAKKEVMVITGENKEWISTKNIEKEVIVKAGDYIFVPKVPVHGYPYYVDLASKYTSILGAVATTALLFIQILKK